MAYQEVLVKFAVSVASQAVLFEAAKAAELSACSGVSKKFREAHVSLAFFVSFLGDAKKKRIKHSSKNFVSTVRSTQISIYKLAELCAYSEPRED